MEEVYMGLEEIEKLKAKLEKDPNSKLFLPLAEEYRKEGMLDEAIQVLLEGLKKYPQYTSARVALGKIYYEKGDTEKAKEVFEEVITTVPDNLFVQKKLAEIYFNEGNLEKALIHYEKVLELNPLDEEIQSLVEALKGQKDEQEGVQEDSEAGGENPEEMVLESTSYEEEEISQEDVAEEVFTENESEIDVTLEAEEDTEEVSVFDLSINSEEEIEEQSNDKDAFSEYQEFSSFIGEQVFEIPETEEEKPEDEKIAGADIHIEQPYNEDDVQTLLNQADIAVKEERYLTAFEIYKKLLNANPHDKTVRQRMEELHLLLKISGKDQNVLIEELLRFKEALKAKANEFPGNS